MVLPEIFMFGLRDDRRITSELADVHPRGREPAQWNGSRAPGSPGRVLMCRQAHYQGGVVHTELRRLTDPRIYGEFETLPDDSCRVSTCVDVCVASQAGFSRI